MSEQKAEKLGGFHFYYGWVIVFVSFMLMALAFVSAYSINSIFVKPVCEGLNVSRGDFSFYLTISNIATLCAAPFLGKFMSKNAKLTNIVCICVLASAYIAISFANNLWTIYAIAVFRGVGYMGACTMASVVYVTNWFGVKKKSTAMGIAMLGSSFGGYFLIPFISNIITNYGWRWGYRAMGILVLTVLILLVVFLIANTPEDKGIARQGDADLPTGTTTPQAQGMILSEARKTYSFWFLYAAVLLMAFACSGLAGHIVAYFQDIGFTAAEGAKIQSYGITAMIVGKLVLGRMGDKFGARITTLVGTLVLVLCYVAAYSLTFSHSLVPFYIAGYSFGTSIGLLAPPLMVSHIFGNKNFGQIIGYTTMANGMGSAIGPLVTGKVFDATGSYLVAWIVLGIAASVCVLCFMIASKHSYINNAAPKSA